MLIVDEYDNHLNGVLSKADFVDGLKAVEDMDNAFKSFFSVLKSAIGNGNGLVRTFIAGVSPLVLSEFASGFNIGRKPMQQREFASLFGLSTTDVMRGLDSIPQLPTASREAVLQYIKDQHDGYRFFDGPDEPLFNTTRVLGDLDRIQRQDLNNTSAEGLLADLRNFIDDNTRPAESALRLASSNPRCLTVITKLLSTPRLLYKPSSPLQFNITLRDYVGIVSSPVTAGLESFLFFQGALTWASNSTREDPWLTIPNNLAREEYIEALKLTCQVRDVTALRNALVSLIESDDVNPLVAAFEAQFLGVLQAHDVLDGEAGFHKRT